MKLFKIAFLALGIFSVTTAPSAQSTKTTGKVTMKGKLINFGETVDLEEFGDIQPMIPKSHNKSIDIKEDSSFTFSMPLAKPGYYRLGRNKLYLSPGDNMEVVVDKSNPTGSTFKGTGSTANIYLCNTLFPKAGSFIEAGTNVMNMPQATFDYIMSAAKDREKELSALKGVSAEFKRLERARIKADIIRSFNSVQGYSNAKFRRESEEFRKQYYEDFIKLSKPVKDSLLRNFVDPAFLQIEVYRDIYSDLDIKAVKNPAWVQTMTEYHTSLTIANKFKSIGEKNKLTEFKASIDSLKTKRYRDVLQQLLAEKMKFGNGDLAIDFEVVTPDGDRTSLSSLKGKVIYIDIWATWCGPCMAEMPYLEQMKEKYKSIPDVAIVSLSIDDRDPIWLRDLERRKAGGIQWRIDRPKLSQYEVVGIPRYILIDKNFVVAEMEAPHASNEKASILIENLLIK
jgi:thiol-disulfide isomerase/thioredoxin